MSPRYRLTPSAQQDVDRITDFIAEDNVEAALRVHDALEEAFRHLAEMPGVGHSRTDLTVIAVLHGARDVGNLLKS